MHSNNVCNDAKIILNMITDRQKQLLEKLIIKNKPLFGNDLANILGVTSRTLRTDIQAINDFLSPNHIQIQSSPRKGYWIENEDKQRIIKILDLVDRYSTCLPANREERQLFIYISLFLTPSWYSMTSLAQKMYISVTTISNDIRTMEDLVNCIKGTTLCISQKNGVRICGKEQNIRHLISASLLYYYDIDSNYLTRVIKEVVPTGNLLSETYRLLVRNLVIQNILLSQKSLKILAMEILLFIEREKLGFNLLSYKQQSELNLSLPIDELSSLFSISLSKPNVKLFNDAISRKRFLSMQENFPGNNLQYEKIIMMWFCYVKNHYRLDLSNETDLINHLKSAFFNLTVAKTTYDYSNEICNNYPYAYEIAKSIQPFISESFHAVFDSSELSRLTLRLVVILDSRLPLIITVIIVDNNSFASFLKYRIHKLFSGNIQIVATGPDYIINSIIKENQEVSLILATHPVITQYDIDLLFISPLLDQNDINNINDYLFRNNFKNRK